MGYLSLHAKRVQQALVTFTTVFTLGILALTFFSQPAIGQDFYDIESVNTIEITFDEDNWADILAAYYDAGDEERLVGSALINGELFDSVGVRYKGNSSYVGVNGPKKPFNIKLDHIIDDQEIDGYGTLKLSNAYKDPSFVREVLSYEIGRKYMPTSLANYMNVYVNGEHIGLYTSVQSVDKHFLRSHLLSEDNSFFKGDAIESPGPGGGMANLAYLGPDSTYYYTSYELKSDYGWNELVNLCDTLNNHTASVDDILDVDRTLWHMAFHNVLVNLDSPINYIHNFYLYMADNRQFNYILWDLNESFGSFRRSGIGPGQELTIQQLQQLDPFYNNQNPSFPVLVNLLNDPDLQKQYIAHMRTIVEENFSNGWYETRANEIQAIIDDHVLADANKFYSYNDFLNNVENQVGQVPGIVQLMDARATYLLNNNWFLNEPEISQIVVTPEIIPPNSEVWVTAEVDNADNVTLAYRYQHGERFTSVEMFDDGQHNDGQANDGLFGGSIDVNNSGCHYYIYAENNSAATFSPARAEYEFYNIDVVDDLSDVVINEFMASNDTTAADQDGEYDDWIELFNTGDEDVSLSGCYLTDDETELFQWAFPDTSIEANGYLIVWADEDEEQEGLHASFKLSAGGESVLLVDSDGETVDGIDFGEQDEDISFGRFPNGTGPFLQMTPTFSDENVDGFSGAAESTASLPLEISLHQNYPNPFNASTTISYDLQFADQVKIQILNILGEEVITLVDTRMPAGSHSIAWTGTDRYGQQVSSGIYLTVLKSGQYQLVNKMIMMK